MACNYNLSRKSCKAANRLLQPLNLPPMACDDCRLLQRLYEMRLLISHDDKTQSTISEWLEAIGLASKTKKKQKPTKGAICSLTGLNISHPCQREDCKYYVNYKWSFNCLGCYLEQTGESRTGATLRNEEIAFLYNMSVDDVQQAYNLAMQQLRSVTIKHAQEAGELPERLFNFLKTNEVCCVCESFIVDGEDDSYITMLDGTELGYCSRECPAEKPPQIIALEYRFGINAETIVRWALHKFYTMSAFEDATGLPRNVLEQMCRRYGIDMISHFPTLARRRRHKIVMLLKGAMNTMEARLQYIYDRYGPTGLRPIAQRILAQL